MLAKGGSLKAPYPRRCGAFVTWSCLVAGNEDFNAQVCLLLLASVEIRSLSFRHLALLEPCMNFIQSNLNNLLAIAWFALCWGGYTRYAI